MRPNQRLSTPPRAQHPQRARLSSPHRTPLSQPIYSRCACPIRPTALLAFTYPLHAQITRSAPCRLYALAPRAPELTAPAHGHLPRHRHAKPAETSASAVAATDEAQRRALQTVPRVDSTPLCIQSPPTRRVRPNPHAHASPALVARVRPPQRSRCMHARRRALSCNHLGSAYGRANIKRSARTSILRRSHCTIGVPPSATAPFHCEDPPLSQAGAYVLC